MSCRKEWRQHFTGNSPTLKDNPRPRNFETGVLHIYRRQRIVLAAVPGLLRRAKWQQGRHPLIPHNPHLGGMLAALLDSAQRIDPVLTKKVSPSPLDRIWCSEWTRRPQKAEAIVRTSSFA